MDYIPTKMNLLDEGSSIKKKYKDIIKNEKR